MILLSNGDQDLKIFPGSIGIQESIVILMAIFAFQQNNFY